MEILFTILLLVVPIFSVVSLCVSLIAIRNVKSLKELVTALIHSVRGEAATPLDSALDSYAMRL